jgi:hypothetical protein
MDRRVIEAKLEGLRRCVKRLEQKQPSTPQALATDYDLQDIICHHKLDDFRAFAQAIVSLLSQEDR